MRLTDVKLNLIRVKRNRITGNGGGFHRRLTRRFRTRFRGGLDRRFHGRFRGEFSRRFHGRFRGEFSRRFNRGRTCRVCCGLTRWFHSRFRGGLSRWLHGWSHGRFRGGLCGGFIRRFRGRLCGGLRCGFHGRFRGGLDRRFSRWFRGRLHRWARGQLTRKRGRRFAGWLGSLRRCRRRGLCRFGRFLGKHTHRRRHRKQSDEGKSKRKKTPQSARHSVPPQIKVRKPQPYFTIEQWRRQYENHAYIRKPGTTSRLCTKREHGLYLQTTVCFLQESCAEAARARNQQA